MGSSQTRAWTHVPCIGRRILDHCATREARCLSVLKFTSVCDTILSLLFAIIYQLLGHYVPWMLAPGLLCFFPLCLLTSSLKLLVYPAFKPHPSFTLSFPGSFTSSSLQLSWALLSPRWYFGNLELGDSPLCTHPVLPSSHLFSSSGPCSLGTSVFSGFLLPSQPFLPAVDSRESLDCHLTNTLIFSFSELAP